MFENGTNGPEPTVEADAEDRIERWHLNAEDSRMVYDALTNSDRDVSNKLLEFFEEVEQLRKVLFEPPSRRMQREPSGSVDEVVADLATTKEPDATRHHASPEGQTRDETTTPAPRALNR